MKFTILLIYKFYISTHCLFAGTDKERLCVSKIPAETWLQLCHWSVFQLYDCPNFLRSEWVITKKSIPKNSLLSHEKAKIKPKGQTFFSNQKMK